MTAVRSTNGTLTATTVATVTLDADYDWVEVVNLSGSAAIYFTVDGTTPTVAGDNTDLVPNVAGARVRVPAPGQTSTVKLISSGTPTYHVVGRPL